HADERSLVEHYRDAPFVVLSVNGDGNPATLRKCQQIDGLTWPAWWDGSCGPIARHWGIECYPTVYLIDARGVIRRETQGAPRSQELVRQIDELLQETR